MDPSSDALAKYFTETVTRMLQVMSRARSIEFHIRLLAEIKAHQRHLIENSYDEFVRKEVDYPRKKLERHIRDAVPKKASQLMLIRQCADSLAHADYREARRRVHEYKSKYGLPTSVSSEPVGLFFYKDIVHLDGKNEPMGYLVASHPRNLILEEFRAFEGQGYLAGSEHMLGIAELELRVAMPSLPVTYGAVVVARGLKYGKRDGA